VANGTHGFQFGGLELYLEAYLYRDNQIDVIEGVPFGHARRGQLGSEDQSVVFEEVAEDGCEKSVDGRLLHRVVGRLSVGEWGLRKYSELVERGIGIGQSE